MAPARDELECEYPQLPPPHRKNTTYRKVLKDMDLWPKSDPNANMQDLTVRMIVSRIVTGTPPALPDGVCWPWQGGVNNRGYGLINYTNWGKRHSISVNRAILAVQGLVPWQGRALVARHTCDNPGCCNPRHIIPGTPKDNMADMWARGRSADQMGRPRKKVSRVRSLTDDQVRAIRKDWRPLRDVAEDYGVGVGQISKIRTGKAKHLVAEVAPSVSDRV